MTQAWRVPGYVHQGGNHCESTALRNALAHQGLQISEELAFGIGGGLGFVYRHAPGMAAPFIGARYENQGALMMTATAARLGVSLEVREGHREKTGLKLLKEALRQGQTPVLWGDLAYLPYLGLPANSHFGGHCFIVFGLDAAQGLAQVSDCGHTPVTMTLRQLTAAWGSRFEPLPPRRRLAVAARVPAAVAWPDAVKQGVKVCCQAMLNPTNELAGLPGLQNWARLVRQWPRQFDGPQFFGALANIFRCIEISGTGGAGFRIMYTQFLKEAHRLLQIPALERAAALFQESVPLWHLIGEAALPSWFPPALRVRELLWARSRHQKWPQQDSLERLKEIRTGIEEASAAALPGLEKNGDRIVAALARAIDRCAVQEQDAFAALAAAVP